MLLKTWVKPKQADDMQEVRGRVIINYSYKIHPTPTPAKF